MQNNQAEQHFPWDFYSSENDYIGLLRFILNEGEEYHDRTGVGRKSIVTPPNISYAMTRGFPLFTTKKVFFKGVKAELLWFLSGSTNNNDLVALGTTIWDEWAKENGDLGPVYGYQWRNFNGQGIDQISKVIEEIKTNPGSSRLVVSAWNPAQIHEMALPPCHAFFQFFVRDAGFFERVLWLTTNTDISEEEVDRLMGMSVTDQFSILDRLGVPKQRLDLTMYQRSADMFLGVPFNVASYSLLLHMVAAQTGKAPGVFHHVLGDAHIYSNHYEQVKTQLKRHPTKLPRLKLASRKSIFDYQMDDIQILDYNCYPAIKADVAV